MIEVKGIRKSFRDGARSARSDGSRSVQAVPVLRDVDLAIADGEFFCLLGPSGCGKTTLLRIVAGLETPDAGQVYVGGKDVTAAPPHQRGCALVFQNYALWPHLTVGENIAYGLEVRKKAEADIRAILDASLRSYQLEGLENRYPHQLSGGQQQRVALARAMAIRPHAVLMDEPLSNLDAALRKSLRRELLDFHRRAGNTILYVTHDQEEALALSDRIAVMLEGRILELGTPAELYARPRHLETALFLGDMNVLREGNVPVSLRGAVPKTGNAAAGGKAEAGMGSPSASALALCIRPENVVVHSLASDAAGSSASDARPLSGNPELLKGTLAFTEFMGTHATLGVDTPSGRILARASLPQAQALAVGASLALEFPAEHRLWY